MAGNNARKIPVVFYRTRGGSEIVRDWLRALNEKDRNAIGLDLMRVQYRWPVGMPLCRALGDGLWESSNEPPEPSYRAGLLLRSARPDSRTSWIHQENPKDSRRRIEFSSQAKDGIRRLKEIVVTKSKKRKAFRAAANLSSLDGFLKEEGKLEAFQATAIKEVLAWQILEAMKAKNISRKSLAEKMKTSRSQISRLLDPKDGNVTLATLQRAAKMVGRSLRLELV